VDFVPAKFVDTKCMPDGTFQTTLVGQDGLKYQIQSSANLINWTPVVTTLMPGGSCTVTLPISASGPMKYFRAVQIP
jgi:hypothetical protein